MTTVSQIAQLATPFIGKFVSCVDETTGVKTLFKVAKLSDKVGALKDGSKGEYVVLQQSDNVAVLVNVHPRAAKTLFTKGKVDQFVLETDPPKAEQSVDSKPQTKKAQVVDTFTTMTAAGKSRKEIVAVMKSVIGLSEAGCNTYYQNCKSGKWA